MKFFFDNCISIKLARAINALVEPDDSVEHLQKRFNEDTADTTWIEALGRERHWVVVSGDLKIRQRPQEQRVLKAAGLTVFFMAKGFTKLPEWEQVRWLIDKWPLIRQQAELAAVGSAYIVPKVGRKLEPVVV